LRININKSTSVTTIAEHNWLEVAEGIKVQDITGMRTDRKTSKWRAAVLDTPRHIGQLMLRVTPVEMIRTVILWVKSSPIVIRL
jgi:hypothetical protein